MTTFQDPPRQSRRAVRQSEALTGQQLVVDAPVTASRGRTGRRAQLPSSAEWRGDGPAPEGTEGLVPTASEPFTMTTSSPAPVLVSPPAFQRVDENLTADPATPPRPGTGRRASLPAGEMATEVVPPDVPTRPAVSDEETTQDAEPDLGVTVTVPDAPAAETVTVVVPEPAEEPASVASTEIAPAPEAARPVATAEAGAELASRPLTRRELREMRLAAERAAAPEVPEVIGAILNSGPIVLPYLSAGPSPDVAHGVTAAPLTGAKRDVEPESPTPVSATSMIEAPPAGEDAPSSVAAGEGIPPIIEPAPAPAVSTRSAGHWSVREDMDEDIESLENTITRTVGAPSSITTSALVLPAIPQSSDITTSFTGSGEILATGSIDLPRSLSSTGVHPGRIDSSDLDHDPMDREIPSTDSAPVRAIRAVSTHTGSNGMITTKKQSNRTLTVLVVSASTMAVGVVGLLVAGVVLNIFP